jgi:hypothetical protein
VRSKQPKNGERAAETSGPKIKTPTVSQSWDGKPNILLQLMQSSPPFTKEGSHLVCKAFGGHRGFWGTKSWSCSKATI